MLNSKTYAYIEVTKDILTNMAAAFIRAIIVNSNLQNGFQYYLSLNTIYAIYAYACYSLSVLYNKKLYDYTRSLDSV